MLMTTSNKCTGTPRNEKLSLEEDDIRMSMFTVSYERDVERGSKR